MQKVLTVIIALLFTAFVGSAFADSMGMSAPAPMALSTTYRFELASPIVSHAGVSTVSVRLIHVADKKPVLGAIFIQTRADMTPIGMGEMTAPMKALPVTTPGIYPFEIQNGPVWSKTDKWLLTFAAKVQGEAATVTGSLTVELKP